MVVGKPTILGKPQLDPCPSKSLKSLPPEDSSSEEVEAPAIASDSDEEVVFTKPNVAGSTSAAPKNEDVQMAKVVAISEKKGNLGWF